VRDGYELARLLRQAADWVELGGSYGPLDLEDFNGNKVGSVELEGV
jgi:hypothetical protein